MFAVRGKADKDVSPTVRSCEEIACRIFLVFQRVLMSFEGSDSALVAAFDAASSAKAARMRSPETSFCIFPKLGEHGPFCEHRADS